MLRKLTGILLFILFIPAVQASQHASSFGYKIDIPGNWLVFSKDELKDNPDLFSLNNPELSKINPELLSQVSNRVKHGDIDLYFNPSAGSKVFVDNINTIEQIGQLPANSSGMQKFCSRLQGELSAAFNKTVKSYQCTRATVGGKKAVLVEFNGVIDGTRSIQYQVQKSQNILLIFTGTFKLTTLKQERSIYTGIIRSVKFVKEK